MEKLFVISSEDKDPTSNSNSDFICVFNDSSTQQVSRILVRECMVPNVFYNIRSESRFGKPNNVLTLYQGVDFGPLEIIVPQGQYTIDELMTTLTDLMNTEFSGRGTTVNIDFVEHQNVLKFTFSGSPNILNNRMTFDISSTMFNVLGIKENITTETVIVNGLEVEQIICPYSPDLSGINQVKIHSEQVSNGHGLDAGRAGTINLLETVSMHNVEYGSWGYKKNDNDMLCEIVYSEPQNLSRIRIVLRDNEGNKLDIGTKNMSVVLKAYFI